MVDTSIADIAKLRARFAEVLGTVIIGQQAAIDHVLVALLTGGHVLLTGGAATAKGLLVQCVSKLTKLEFRRIQFTPDLMPSDITGTDILEEDAQTGRRTSHFVTGPIFTNLLMADEINRTPPKTQAALLEAMQEKQVTTGGTTRPLPKPFFVFATRTSVETDGTYPLPEAQQDRFMLNVELSALPLEDELKVVLGNPERLLPNLPQVIDGPTLVRFQKLVRDVKVPRSVQEVIVSLSSASRPGQEGALEEAARYIAWGAGVRASQCLALGAKARAAMAGRSEATVADVVAIAEPVMRHRIGLNFRAENEGIDTAGLIKILIDKLTGGAQRKAG